MRRLWSAIRPEKVEDLGVFPTDPDRMVRVCARVEQLRLEASGRIFCNM